MTNEERIIDQVLKFIKAHFYVSILCDFSTLKLYQVERNCSAMTLISTNSTSDTHLILI